MRIRWGLAGVLSALVVLVWLVALRQVGWSFQGLLALAPILAAVSGALLLPLVLLLPGRPLRLAALGVSVVLLLPLLPLGWETARPQATDSGDLRVLTWNMQDNPAAVAAVEEAVAEHDPDLVVLEQTPVAAVGASQLLTERFPFRLLTGPDVVPTSVAILSTYPLGDHEVLGRGPDWPTPRVVVTTVQGPRGTITLFGAHPRWPLPEEGRGYGGWRDPQVADLADAVAAAQAGGADRVLVVGDLNVTTRERAYRSLRTTTGLEDAAGWPAWSAMGTWRRTNRAIPGFLPLDHVLHSPCLESTGTRVLWRHGGSDHASVVAAFDDSCS